MTRKKRNAIRRQAKDGTFASIDYYSRLQDTAQRLISRTRYRQPERKVVVDVTSPVQEGSPDVLGAEIMQDGINFAVHARNAAEVFLVLFDAPEGPATQTIKMPGRTGHIRHCFVRGLKEGQLYGFRARGKFNPAKGLRYNENKFLLDPYARAFAGRFRLEGNLLLPYDPASPEKDFSVDDRDDSQAMPKCMAYGKDFDWGEDCPPRIPMSELILYETHLKGFTAHASSGVANPGTYLGFIEKIPYLQKLGVNAVELLPIHAKFPADHEGKDGKGNYWGYNTYGFFAPEAAYGSGGEPGCEVAEFKSLVKALHKAGMEVILDVVYNHTAEGNELGPLLFFKGLDNPEYYALTGSGSQNKRYYHNHSGTGNTLDFGSPAAVRMAMDSLRYWAREMHVDGFRFDLATVLGRGHWQGFDPRAPFFQAISQDPVLSKVKLIAEPWDCGAFELGNFPVNWSEWNARFRDTARKFVKSDAGQLNELGWCLTGSADLFSEGDGSEGRGPDASINFITCHDGFTLSDLVSYNEKHNEANGEDNRDGYNGNLSWNCGAEGETGDQEVLGLRGRQIRNFAALLFFSQGTPMINAGDEVLRSQKGNNNAYCQDNALTWMDWDLVDTNRNAFEFFRKAIALRKRIPHLLSRKYLPNKVGEARPGEGAESHPDILWFGPDGKAVDWNNPEAREVAFRLEPYLFIFNASPEDRGFALPVLPPGRSWLRVVDTSLAGGKDFCEPGGEEPLLDPLHYRAKSRSVVVLRS
jgi:isoamylase